jgi:hypothetical protein
MKLSSRKPVTLGEQRRNQRQYDRDHAPTLRTTFPQIATLQIELIFSDRTGMAPSSQSHAMFPAARAFFRFACPCFDCDGEFDLSANVTTVAAGTKPASRTSAGQMNCQGMRSRDRITGARCPITLDWRIVMTRAESTT